MMRRYARLYLMGVLILSMLMMTSIRLVFSQEETPEPIPITATPLPPPTQSPPTETPIPPSTTPSPIPTNTETATPQPTLTSTETATALTTETPITTLTPSNTLETATSTPLSVDIVTATPDFIPSSTPSAGDFSFSQPNAVQVLPLSSPIDIIDLPASSTTGDLITAISEANPSSCTHHTIINLPASKVYTLTAANTTTFFGGTGLPIIRCEVTINGDETQIVRSATASNFRIFGVNSPGILRLNGIQVRNGYATSTGGGGILNVFGGQVYLFNSVVEGNTTRQTGTAQTLGGGIYSYQGTLYVENSQIANNTNTSVTGDGGGIGVIDAITTIIGSEISGNGTTRDGGGVAVLFTGAPDVNDNCITLNSRVNSSAVVLSSNGLYANQGATDATDNWWGASTGPSGLGAGTGDAVLGSNITFIPFATVEIPCGPQPLVCPASFVQAANLQLSCSLTLEDFGIELEGSWTPNEQTAILDAAIITGAAFVQMGVATSQTEAFREMMQGINGSEQFRQIRFVKESIGGKYCQTTKTPTDEDYSATIKCDPLITSDPLFDLTEYTVVHEFGHVFVGRTEVDNNTGLLDMVQSPGGAGNPLLNVSSRFVFGPRNLLTIAGTLSDWQRSDYILDNGWGSGAQWYPGEYDEYAAPPVPMPTPTGFPIRIPRIGQCGEGAPTTTSPAGTPYPFQQNPCTFSDEMAVNPTGLVTEIEEAAADMFLNWVYWKDDSDTGFQDLRWRYASYVSSTLCDPINGCPDPDESGEARSIWMNQTMSDLINQIENG